VFLEKVDFVTSPGHQAHGKSRRERGMPGAGPVKVITDKAVLEADPESGELMLSALYPGIEKADVAAGIGWPIRGRGTLDQVAPPTARELHLLREVLDPKRLYLKQ
jgi:glutaconate CoA-transferase subunit B